MGNRLDGHAFVALQTQKEVTLNDALNKLYLALTDAVDVDVATGNLSKALSAMIYPSDAAANEAELGVPAGKGQQFFDLVAGAETALDDARIVALREIGQG